MINNKVAKAYKVRMSHFPVSVFLITLLVLLIIAGLHAGLVELLNRFQANSLLTVVLVILYWIIMSVGFTIFTRYQMKKAYENPMKQLAEATAAVAGGDFSIYVPPIHTQDKLDYLDVMIMDFNTMVEELGSIETLKTDFFSNVSHEIKTPLSAILNYAEMLQNRELTEQKREEYSEAIITSARKLSNLITNILKLNKLEKQSIQPNIELYDICAQLCECAIRFENLWEEKKLDFEAKFEDCAMVEADSELMELVWNNLLSNAVKFTEPGGRIILEQTSTETEIIVTVRDTGCGMTEETRRHIFEKFYQGDTSHATEGNGLGLSLIQRILQMEEGFISVESELKKGTCFTVMIPVTRSKVK